MDHTSTLKRLCHGGVAECMENMIIVGFFIDESHIRLLNVKILSLFSSLKMQRKENNLPYLGTLFSDVIGWLELALALFCDYTITAMCDEGM